MDQFAINCLTIATKLQWNPAASQGRLKAYCAIMIATDEKRSVSCAICSDFSIHGLFYYLLEPCCCPVKASSDHKGATLIRFLAQHQPPVRQLMKCLTNVASIG